MRTRSCNVVRATLVACGTIGLMASLAGAQAVANKNPGQAQQAAAQSPAMKAKQAALEIEAKQRALQKPQAMPATADSKLIAQDPTTTLQTVRTKPTGSTRVRDNNAAGGNVLRGLGFIVPCEDTPFPGAPEGFYAFDTSGGIANGHVPSCVPSSTVAVWMSYSPTVTGTATITTCGGSTGDTVVSVYTDCPIEYGGAELYCNDDDCGIEVQSTISFPVVAGEFYVIRVGGFLDEVVSGTLTISNDGVAPPAPDNDLCEAATVITGSTTGSTTGATGDDVTTCTTNDPLDVWYSFTPTVSGVYPITTCGSAFDTSLAVFTGCGGTQLACNDDNFAVCGAGNHSALTVSLTANVPYLIRIAGWNGASGDFNLNIGEPVPVSDCVVCPMGAVHENETDCLSVNGGCTGIGGYTSINLGDSFCGTVSYDGTTRDLDSFYFNLPTDTVVTLQVTTEFAGVIGFYGPDCPGSGTIDQAILTTPCEVGTTASFCLPAGDHVVIITAQFGDNVACVDAAGSRYTGTITGVPCVAPPAATDECDDPSIPEVLQDVLFNGSNVGASTSLTGITWDQCGDFNPGSAGGLDVWMTFSPTTSGNYSLDLCGSALDTVVAVFSGCPADAGSNLLACNDDAAPQCGTGSIFGSRIEAVTLNAGTTYYIRVAGWGEFGATGPFQLLISAAAPPRDDDECNGPAVPEVTAGNLYFGDNFGATNSNVGLAPAQCGDFPLSNGSLDVWVTFNPTVSTNYSIDLCGSALDTVVAVFSGCPASAGSNLVVCNDDALPACGNFNSRIDSVFLSTGQTYYIRIAGYGTATGSFQMLITELAPPSGACCTGGVCTVVSEADCVGGGGTWQGANAPCDTLGTEYTYTSDPFIEILDSTCPGGPSDSIVVSDSFNIAGIAVRVQVTHTFLADLQLRLSNGINEIIIWDDQCLGNDNMDITFQDGAGVVLCATPTTGTYNPLNPLAPFVGQPSNGTWTLSVCDDAGGDTGTLTSWSLILNEPGSSVCGPAFCDADWCQDGEKSVSDIFCFLADWFGDLNGAREFGGTPGVPAIFAYLAVWFATPNGPCVP